MGKERVIKHAVPFTGIQEQMFEWIEVELADKEEILSDEEVISFWSSFHQELMDYEKTAASQHEELPAVRTFVYEESIEELAKLEQVPDKVMINPVDGIKAFLNVHIRVLFLGVMSLNILWMEILDRNYGDNAMIQLMEYLMIIMVIGFLISWIKPDKKVFRKMSTHD